MVETKLKERTTIALLSLFGFLVVLLTVRITQQGDMGTFLTVAGLVSKGYKLYAEILEIKDPGFLYSAAIALKWFGIRGPFILDGLFVLVSAPVAYMLLRKFICHQYIALVASVMFTLTLTGSHYESFRTQIAAIILFLTASLLVLNSRHLLAGVALFLMIAFKFGFILFIPVVLSLFFKKRMEVSLQNLINFLLGFFGSLILFCGIMVNRGEFFPYLGALSENFYYAKIAQETYGLPVGIMGHLQIWNNITNNYGWIYIFEVIVLFTLCVKNRKNLRALHYFTLNTNLVILVFLGSSLLWGHHLQILSLSLLLNFACIADLLAIKIFSISRDSISKSKVASLMSFLVLLIFTASPVYGTKLPLDKLQITQTFGRPTTFNPPEIDLLNNFARNSIGDEKITVARLGGIDDLGYGYFLNTEKFEFTCTRPYIVGIESKKQMAKYVTCLKSTPTYITVGPYFTLGNPYNPIYQSGKEQIQNILLDSFHKISSLGGYDIYKRK